MRLGRVVGAVWCTKKCSELRGYKLLLVREMEGKGRILVCADVVGAGAGERVVVAGGAAARLALADAEACVDGAVVAIVDGLEWQEPNG